MKNTKRSMLITTVLMVVVLVVAISTSTFAWYTAAGTGAATSASITSAESSAANITVGWTKDAKTSTIEFYNAAGALAPMCPTAELTAGTPSFNTNTLSATGIFNDNVAPATPWSVADAAEATYSSFFVANKNVNAAANVTMTMATEHAESDAEVMALLRVAVFTKTTGEEEFSFKGVLGGSYVYGVPTSGTEADDLDSGDGVANIVFNLAKAGEDGDYVEIKLYAWFDGTALTQEFAGETVDFSFNFAA